MELVGPIDGARKGTCLYFVKGQDYFYRKNRTRKNRDYFKCIVRSCTGLGVRSNNLFHLTREHSCDPSPNAVEVHISNDQNDVDPKIEMLAKTELGSGIKIGLVLLGPIEGVRRGSSAYYIEGENYLYKKNRQRGHHEYFRCIVVDCHGHGIRRHGLFHITKEHTCEPKPNFLTTHLSKIRMKCRAESEATELRQIYEEEKSKSDLNLEIKYKDVQSSLIKRRRLSLPPLPENVSSFVDAVNSSSILSSTIEGEEFFQTCQVTSEGENVIFASACATNALRNTNEIHVNVTYNITALNKIGFTNICTVHVIYKEHSFPVVFALMTRESIAAYSSVFQYVGGKLCCNAIHFITDYNTILQSSLREVFPHSTILGSHSHFTQCIWNQLELLGLQHRCLGNVLFTDIIKMIFCIPLLPHDRLMEGWVTARNEAISHNLLNMQMNSLFQYVRTNWIEKLGPSLSVFDNPKRNCNNIDVYHSHLVKRLGVDPNLWVLIRQMRNLEKNVSEEFFKLASNNRIKSDRRCKYLGNEKLLQDASIKLISQNYSVQKFMQQCRSLIHISDKTVANERRVDTKMEGSPLNISSENIINSYVEINDNSNHLHMQLHNQHPHHQPQLLHHHHTNPHHQTSQQHLLLNNRPLDINVNIHEKSLQNYSNIPNNGEHSLHQNNQPYHSDTVSAIWPVCSVCCLSPVRTIFLPCLHHTTCESCSAVIMQQNRLCPTCRSKISSSINPLYNKPSYCSYVT